MATLKPARSDLRSAGTTQREPVSKHKNKKQNKQTNKKNSNNKKYPKGNKTETKENKRGPLDFDIGKWSVIPQSSWIWRRKR